MISWIDFRDFFEINSGLYGRSQAPLPPAEMMVALMTIAQASHGTPAAGDRRTETPRQNA